MDESAAQNPGRLLPRSLSGWKRVVLDVKGEVERDQLTVLAAGLAFYAILSVFPMILAIVSIYGLFAPPEAIQRHLAAVFDVMPAAAAELVRGQVEELVQSRAQLGLGLILSLGAVLWSTSTGMSSLVRGIDIAYSSRRNRGMVHTRILALMLSLGLVGVALIVLALAAVLPVVLNAIDAGRWLRWLLQLTRWPFMATLVIGSLITVYRVAPEPRPRGHWLESMPGAVLATLLWLVGSAAFSAYASRFGTFNETYGALGAVVVFMLWLWLSAFCVLLGAELNAVLARRVRRSSAPPPPAPRRPSRA